MQRTGEPLGQWRIHSQAGFERLFEARDVGVVLLAPAVLAGIGVLLNIQLNYGNYTLRDFADLAYDHGCCLTSSAFQTGGPILAIMSSASEVN